MTVGRLLSTMTADSMVGVSTHSCWTLVRLSCETISRLCFIDIELLKDRGKGR
jgi:hypothetical protein